MSDPTVKVRVQLDGSGVAPGVKQTNDELAKIGPAAERSAGQAVTALGKLGSAAVNSAGQAAPAIQKVSSATDGLTLSSTHALRSYVELMRGLASGQPAETARGLYGITMHTGLMRAAFTGAGAAIAGVVVILGGFISLAVSAANQQAEYNKALIMTGNYSRTTTAEMTKMTTEIGAATGHFGDARTALGLLASSGLVTRDALKAAAQGAVDFGTLTGQSVEKGVEAFAKLSQDPVRTLVQLNSQYHFLSVAQYEHVLRLQQEGDAMGATTEATKILAAALHDREEAYVQTLSGWDRMWQKIKSSIGEAIDKTKQFILALPSPNEMFWNYLWPGGNTGADKRAAYAASPQGAADAAGLKQLIQSYQDYNAELKRGEEYIINVEEANKDALKTYQKLIGTYGQGREALERWITAEGLDEIRRKVSNDLYDEAVKKYMAIRMPIQLAAAAYDKMTAAQKVSKTVTDESGRAIQDFTDYIIALEGAIGDPMAKALADYQLGLDAVDKRATDMLITMSSQVVTAEQLNAIFALMDRGYEAVTQRTIAQTGAIKTLDMLTQEFDQSLAEDVRMVKMSADERQVEEQVTRLLNAATHAGIETNEQWVQSERAKAEASQKVQIEYMKEKEIESTWQQLVTSGFDAMANSLANFAVGGFNTMHDFWQALLNDAKQFIAAIIAQMLKLTVFNGIINSIFNLTGSSALPTMSFSQLLSGAGGVVNGVTTGGLNVAGSIVGGGSYLLGDVGGNSLWDRIKAIPNIKIYGDFTLGNLFSILGGASLGYRLGGTGGAIAGGAIGFAFKSIPWVGWAMTALSFIDSFTGGKLFGTKWGATGQQTSMFDIGPGGGSASAEYQQVKEGAFFSGKKYRDVKTAASQEAIDSIELFYTNLKDLITSTGKDLEAIGQVVTGHYTQTMDKNGNIIVQESKVLGQKYTESFEDFQKRITAESLLTLVPAGNIIAEQWRKNVDELLAGAQFLIAAQMDIKNKQALIEGESLADLTKFITGMKEGSETLIDTYARLKTESVAVDAIFKALGLDTGRFGEELVKFDDALVKAAGDLDTLTTLADSYYQHYYTDSERQARNLANLRETVETTFAAIGEDTNVSMTQFREDFDRVFPMLTPEQIANWWRAADALYNYDYALGITTQQLQEAKDQTLAGFADLISTAAANYVRILAETQALTDRLFGTEIDRLRKLREQYIGNIQFLPQLLNIDKQIADAEARQLAAQRLADATQLMTNLGAIGVVSGQSLEDLAKQFNIPLDQFAQFMNTDIEGLEKQYEKSEQMARAAMDTAYNTEFTNRLLADILATVQGQPLPYSLEELWAMAGPQPYETAQSNAARRQRGTVPYGMRVGGPMPVAGGEEGDKGVGRGGIAPAGSTAVAVSVDNNTRTLGDVADKLEEIAKVLDSLRTTIDRRGLARTTPVPVTGFAGRLPA